MTALRLPLSVLCLSHMRPRKQRLGDQALCICEELSLYSESAQLVELESAFSQHQLHVLRFPFLPLAEHVCLSITRHVICRGDIDLRLCVHMLLPVHMLAILTALGNDREHGWGRGTGVLQVITVTELHCWHYQGR